MSNTELRIIGFTGAKGTGKSSVAMNLALAWAGTQSRRVLIISFPSPRRKTKSKRAVDASVLLKLPPFDLGRRASVSPFGVGTARVSAKTPAPAVFGELERLGRSYDLFLDVDPDSPLRETALAACRRIFWLTSPRKSPDGVLPERCELVVNRSRAGTTGPDAPVHLPYDPAVPLYDGAGRLLIVDRIQSPWIGALRPLLGRVMDLMGAANS